MKRKGDMGDVIEGYFNDPDYNLYMTDEGLQVKYEPRGSETSAREQK